MRKLLFAAGAMTALALCNPAHGAVIVNSSDVGVAHVIDFAGEVDGTPDAGLSSLLTLTLTSVTNGGKTFNFGYTMLNDSTLASRMRSFGFDVDPDLASASSTGAIFDNVEYDDNMSDGNNKVDVCFRADGGNVCTGGPNGLTSGNSTNGTLSLTFGSSQTSLSLDNFMTRYQDIVSPYGKSGAGFGTEVPAVPEPATWALMMLGLFGAGAVLRRRSQPQVRIRYA